MTPQQAQTYVENCLKQLGWRGSLVTAEAAELISEFVNGDPALIDRLCNLLVSRVGESRKDYRITKAAVRLAIRDLAALDKPQHPPATETPDQSTAAPPDRPTDRDIASIEQLAAELERKMLSASQEETRAASHTQTAQSQEDSGKPKVVVVDDSPTVRTVIHAALGNDFVCVEAKNGEVAWDMLLTDPEIVVAIVDLEMPALDGYGLIRRIRSAHIGRIAALPIIVVTSATDTIAKKEAYLAGADDFINKTSDPLDLLVRVRTHFRLAQTKSALEHERHFARGQTATQGKNVEAPTANQGASNVSQSRQTQGGSKAKEGAPHQAVHHQATARRASPSTARPLPAAARAQDMRTYPVVKMTLVATALVLVVIGVIKYQQGSDAPQSADETNVIDTQQFASEQQALDAQEPVTDPSMQATQETFAQQDLLAEKPRADEEGVAEPSDQLSEVSDAKGTALVASRDVSASTIENPQDASATPADEQIGRAHV